MPQSRSRRARARKRRAEQRLIDETEKKMTAGEPLSEFAEALAKSDLRPGRLIMNKQDFDDLVKWAKET